MASESADTKKIKWKSFNFGPELEKHSKLRMENEKNNANVEKDTDKHTNIEKDIQIKVAKSFNLHDKLTPRTIDELAVHSKKIEEIRKWLTLNILNEKMKYPFLLLTGPSGSAKTTTINVICRNLSISVSEWVNPIDKDSELIKTGHMKRFMEFLTDSKWNSLFQTNTKKITLVKDFPNAVLYQPEEFYNILNECYKNPIVFICTDASSNSTNFVRTLFTDDVISKYNITHISFNKCSSTLMKKAMKRAQLIIQENFPSYKQPLPSTIDTILAVAMGDIRNAVNNYSLECLLETDVKNLKKMNTKKKSENEMVSFRHRDENLGLFHGLGRILNPKRKQVLNSWRLNCDIEKLVAEFSMQSILLITFLFENYLQYFGSISDASNAADVLSLSLNIVENQLDKQCIMNFGLWISVLGLMIYNENRVTGWKQIRGPTKSQNLYKCGHETNRLEPMDYLYYNIIKHSSSFDRFDNK